MSCLYNADVRATNQTVHGAAAHPVIFPIDPSGPGDMRKDEIINLLARQRGYRRYLEVGYHWSGFRFEYVSDSLIKERIWWSPLGEHAEPRDGLPVTYRERADRAFARIRADRKRYDIIFIDSVHTYEQVMRDVSNSLACLDVGGAIVLHDCNPPEEDFTGAKPSRPDGWCGDVYQAVIRFRLDRPDLAICVVDTDFGCGIIERGTAPALNPLLPVGEDTQRCFRDYIEWHYFNTHRKQLLNLITVDEFRRRLQDEKLRLADSAHVDAARALPNRRAGG